MPPQNPSTPSQSTQKTTTPVSPAANTSVNQDTSNKPKIPVGQQLSPSVMRDIGQLGKLEHELVRTNRQVELLQARINRFRDTGQSVQQITWSPSLRAHQIKAINLTKEIQRMETQFRSWASDNKAERESRVSLGNQALAHKYQEIIAWLQRLVPLHKNSKVYNDSLHDMKSKQYYLMQGVSHPLQFTDEQWKTWMRSPKFDTPRPSN